MMKTNLIQHQSGNYLQIDLEQVIQKNHSFYLAKIKASEFIKIYTVRPAQYDLEKHSSLAKSFSEEADYYNHLINEDKENIKEKDFQRDPNETRVSGIVKFLQNEEYSLFPNTIIANCELINDWGEYPIDEKSTEEEFFAINDKPAFLSFLKKDSDNYSLFVPFKSNSVLVIDGQHRLEGLKKSSLELQENFDLIISFLIGFDRSIIAKQFYTINYEQKPVNKSLLYQLTGEFSREINELSFMHNVVKLLNELEESPFYGRVKMLGTTPKNYSSSQKQKLSISQAFFIDSSIRFISDKAKGTMYPPIFLKYYKNEEEHIIIIRVLARFFNAVKDICKDWEHPSTSIISKGMGVGALLRVLNLLFPILFVEELKCNWDAINSLKIDDYKRFLRGLEKIDFSSNGPYGKTGSAGSITKIKNDIISSLEYINSPTSAEEFEENLKSNQLITFNNALSEI